MSGTMKFLLVCMVLGVHLADIHASIEGYITPSDKKKFLNILVKAFQIEQDDVSLSLYGAKAFQIFKEPLEKSYVQDNCARLQKLYKPTASLDASFNALSAWNILGCNGNLHTDAILKSCQSALESDKSTTADIRYAAEILILLKQAIPNPAKVAQFIQAKLKEDDSLPSLGQALHAASLLGNAGKFINDRIEDITVQMDEIDGKLLQWEGGLTTTSLLITGLLRLPEARPLTSVQADKLANYLLTRKTVQTPKGILALLEAASALSASPVSPVSISIQGSSQIPIDKPQLKVQVSDIFGQAVKPVLSPVLAQSATRIADDVVVLAKQPLSVGTNSAEFILNLNLEPGYYRIVLNVGSHTATFTTRILGPLQIKSLEIGLTDSDGSSVPKLTKLSHPSMLEAQLKADSSQRLVVKFSLSRTVHQAFLRLFSGKKEIIFVAEQDSAKVYKVEVNLVSELSNSGTFDIELILGDSIITNPIRWSLGTVDVKLGSGESPVTKLVRGPKPEIEHLFRQAEKRPAEVVSLFFTALTAAPLLVLLVLWTKIGINFGNFSTISLPFHLGLGAILSLFTLFWLKLDMFTTCAWLIPIGGFTFLSGHKLLSHIARHRKQEKAEK